MSDDNWDRVSAALPIVSAGREGDREAFAGERFLPGYADGTIELEHVHRYVVALPRAVGSRVLDVACGEGYGSDLLAQVADSVVGVDIDAECVLQATERYKRQNLEFRQGRATAIPADDHAFDLVVSFETIEHVEDHEVFWDEIRRVLKPGGLLIISSPNRDVYRAERSSDNPYHVRELTREELLVAVASRFAHHVVMDQSIVFGSQLVPDGGGGAYWEAALDPQHRRLSFQDGDAVSRPYSVVLASDQPVRSPGPSLYRGPYPRGAMSALIGGISERDQTIRVLRDELTLRTKTLEVSQQQEHRIQIEIDRLGSVIAERNGDLARCREQGDKDALRLRRMEESIAEKQDIISSLKEVIAAGTIAGPERPPND